MAPAQLRADLGAANHQTHFLGRTVGPLSRVRAINVRERRPAAARASFVLIARVVDEVDKLVSDASVAGATVQPRVRYIDVSTGISTPRTRVSPAVTAPAGHPKVTATTAGVVDQRDLAELSLSELQQFSDKIQQDVFEVLTLEGSVSARNHLGGTAPEQVRAAVQRARQRLAD